MIPAMPIEEFRVHVPDEEIEDLHRRLESARLPDQLAGSGWGYGTDRDTLAEWITHWRENFDWRAVEAKFNAFEQGVTEAAGERVHFVHAPSSEPNATCLLYTSPSPRDATLSRMPSSA